MKMITKSNCSLNEWEEDNYRNWKIDAMSSNWWQDEYWSNFGITFNVWGTNWLDDLEGSYLT